MFVSPAHAKGKIAAGAVIVVLVAAGLQAGWVLAFSDQVYPGVRVAGLDAGGMTQDEVVRLLQDTVTERISAGITLRVDEEVKHLALDVIAEDDPDLSRPLIDANIDAAAATAMEKGRSPHPVLNLFSGLLPLIERPHVELPLTIATEDLTTRILETFPEKHEEPAPTSFMITAEDDGWLVAIQEGQERTSLNLETPLAAIQLGFSRLDTTLLEEPIDTPTITLKPRVTLEEAAALIPDAESLLATAPFSLTFTDERHRTSAWSVDDVLLANLLIPTPEGINLDEAGLEQFFEPIEAHVNVAAQDARFEASEGRAGTFVPSHSGREVDVEASARMLREHILRHTTEPLELIVHETAPRVVLSDANDLGITELLGTGVSDYTGSPPNRIKNIRNGVRLLNGLLIAPGERFSLIQALQPFTFENGYLPELVIKGDEIIPEMGGGLCQIGSTTFRATMNSGLEVAERRNHSLVVSYYNDPANGNPGTDATLYDPAPDYKLINDTEHYILLEAVMDERNQKLSFSFWGTSDGRKGSYSAPEVEQWIGAGETRYIETTDIPEGTTRCQGAHPGAVASFTYTVNRPDGSVDERLFSSRYRSLPKICLVGVEPDTLDEDSDEAEEALSTESDLPQS